MNYFKKIVILLLFTLISSGVIAANFIGIVGVGIGDVKNQNNQKLENGSKIFYGDTIIVGSKSTAQILFLDQTVMTIGEESELTIDEFVYDPQTSDGKLISNIKSGTVKVITGQISRKNPDNLEVKIPTGTIGARGTEFVVIASSNAESTVLLLGPGPNNSLGMMPGTLEVSDGINTVNIAQPGFETVVTK